LRPVSSFHYFSARGPAKPPVHQARLQKSGNFTPTTPKMQTENQLGVVNTGKNIISLRKLHPRLVKKRFHLI